MVNRSVNAVDPNGIHRELLQERQVPGARRTIRQRVHKGVRLQERVVLGGCHSTYGQNQSVDGNDTQ